MNFDDLSCPMTIYAKVHVQQSGGEFLKKPK